MNNSVGAMGDARDTTILEDSARTRFRSGDYVEAISIYTKLLEKQSQDKSLDSSRQLLRSKWLGNRALARYKIGDLDSCSIDCLEAIENDPHNLKAHFRLIQVHQDQNNFEAALDILRSLKYSKVLQSAHSSWSVLVRTKENEVKKCKESNKPNALTLEESSAMVSQHHTLRLCIKKSPPLHCTVGKPFQVEVYLSNEFGLFSKELLPRTGDSVLQADQRVVVQVLDTTSYQVSSIVSCVAVMEKPRNEFAQETTSNAHLVKYRKCPMWIWFNVSDKCQFQAHNCALHISIEGCYKINPVLTRPVVVYQTDVFETQHNIDGPEYNGYGTNYRVLEMNDSIKVCLVERPEDYGIPGKVWDGSYVLLDYLQNKVDWKALSDNTTSDDGLHVLELGAGTGVLGIALAKLELDEIASITITDLPSVVALIQENIDLNFSLDAQQRQKLCSAAYTWGEPLDGISKLFQNSHFPNVIVMSDVVYSPEFYQPLFDSLVLLCNNNTIVYWAHRHRNPNDYHFFIKLCTKFNLLTVCGSLPRLEIDEQSGQENETLLRELDNCRRSFVAECDTDDGVETRGDVSIHRLQLK